MSTGSSAERLQAFREAAAKTKGFQCITALFDEGTFNEVDGFAKSGDGSAEVVAGYGEVDGCPAYAFVQNSDVDGGAMSKAQAAKIKKIYDLAVKTGSPVVGIYDSIGGRLNQGADMLAAYGEILLGNNNLSGVVPQISLVLGPCLGTSAMIAASADIVVMTKKAQLTIDTTGKDGTVEDAAKLGICHVVAKDDQEAMMQVRKLLAVLPSNNLAGAPVVESSDPSDTARCVWHICGHRSDADWWLYSGRYCIERGAGRRFLLQSGAVCSFLRCVFHPGGHAGGCERVHFGA